MQQAAAFQIINPKSWIFALGAVTTFRPTTLPMFSGTLLVTITMILVILPTAWLWAAGGGAISRLIQDDRVRRSVNLTLAVILAANRGVGLALTADIVICPCPVSTFGHRAAPWRDVMLLTSNT